ncbi:MAG TPA: cytochrome b N-terminal domain-containing protein [Polyangia bacterium]
MGVAVARDTEQYPFALGGTAIALGALQIATGLLLAARYEPGAAGAYASVAAITHAAPFGWFLRGLHRAAAGLMVAAVVVHLARTFVAGAYRAPRRATWVTGVALLLVTLAFGFTGFALIGDADAAAGTAVARRLLGPAAALLGGDGAAVGRLYVAHIAALPLALAALGAAHVLLVRRHAPAPGAPDTVPFAPDHVLLQALVALAAVVLAVALAVAFPPPLGPAAAGAPPVAPRPEWYLLPPYAALKLLPQAAAGPGLAALAVALAAWPWLEARAVRGPRAALAAAGLRTALVLVPLAVSLWEALS